MPYTFTNLRDTPVVLNPGVNDAVIPPGWSGSVNLLGEVSVYGQEPNVVTNSNANAWVGSLVTVNNTGHSIEWFRSGGTPTFPMPVSESLYGYLTPEIPEQPYFNFGVPPRGNQVTVTVDGYYVESGLVACSFNVTTPWVDTLSTNYTNILLGTYTGAQGVVSVEVDGSAVRVADYSAEHLALMQGFVLGITVHCLMYVFRLLKAMASQNFD